MLTVVCFKWKRVHTGYQLPMAIDEYTHEHVNNLYNSVTKHLTIPHRFICITDDPTGILCETYPLWDKYRELGGCYHRLYTFSEEFREIAGDRFVCIDLDVVITGNLDKVFSRTEDFIINKYISKDRPKQYYNGGLYMMNAGSRKQVWDTFNPEISLPIIKASRKRRETIGSDQEWIAITLGKGEATFGVDDGVYDYRLLPNKEKLPKNACMVFFPGKRDPSQFTHDWILSNWHSKDLQGSLVKRSDKKINLQQEILRASKILGYNVNIEKPKTFNEHLLYRKFFYKSPLLTLTADKVRVKNYVKAILGTDVNIIPEIWSGSNPLEIPFEKLIGDCIIKPNHMSGRFIVIKNGNYNKRDVIDTCNNWLAKSYGQNEFEWGYKNIPRKIIIQKWVGNDSTPPEDYKFHVFNGKCEFLYVEEGKLKNNIVRTCYSTDWVLLDFKYKKFSKNGKTYQKPVTLKEMIFIAEKLSLPFKFVRVDLFTIGDKIYFGEMTHYPDSGTGAFVNYEDDLRLGTLFH